LTRYFHGKTFTDWTLGGFYQVTSKDNAKQSVFIDDEDKGRFLEVLSIVGNGMRGTWGRIQLSGDNQENEMTFGGKGASDNFGAMATRTQITGRDGKFLGRVRQGYGISDKEAGFSGQNGRFILLLTGFRKPSQ
jgi:hypothetical protein